MLERDVKKYVNAGLSGKKPEQLHKMLSSDQSLFDRIPRLNRQKSQSDAVRKGKKSKQDRKIQVLSMMYLLPSLIGACVFFFVPYLVVIFYSVVDNPIARNFVGLENYIQVLGNGAYKTAIQNTLSFSVVSVPLAVILSLILAMVLDSNIPFRTQFRTFFLSPMMVPVASIVLVWQVLFDLNGSVNVILNRLGVTPVDWLKSDRGIVVVVILFLWKNLGYNMILFLAALSSIPKDILEVARLESATPVQIFFIIKLRYMASTIVFVTIMSIINSFKIFREVYLLTTDHPFGSVYLLQHFMNNKFKSLDYQTLSAAAIILSLAMIVLICILFGLEGHFSKDLEG